MRKLTLCADDFGLNHEVNRAITQLVRLGRLNAVSCMSVGSGNDEDIEELLSAVSQAPIPVETGVHLTFTEYSPIGTVSGLTRAGQFPSISSLLLKTHLGQIERQQVELEMVRQLDFFESKFKREPNFLDGHQHVHILPVFRDVILNVVKKRYNSNVWVRSCHRPWKGLLQNRTSFGRALLISSLSARLRKSLAKNNIDTNDNFLGVNSFDTKDRFASLMYNWLSAASRTNGRTLIMCHPGEKLQTPSDIYDPIADQRPFELGYLLSDKFLSDLKTQQLSLNMC